MRINRTGFVILVLTWLSIHSVESQFGQEYRSWFGSALRFNPFISTCQLDGEPCPPWNKEPIIEKCLDYDRAGCHVFRLKM
ncbi:unnamed protein product [Allacma fusca]|uniref:Secreted protein n=1 Tax=Allacma fusca TaxID=39272 RepID=A0A8J2P2T2_9HEXA|nr:unnamed protein product [Allacma fusca]